MIQWMLASWSLVPLPFLNPVWTCGISWLMDCWSWDQENFDHYFTSVWDEYNCVVIWTFFGIAFLWNWKKTNLFQSCGHCWVFQICWHIECSTFTASSFRILNSSTGITRATSKSTEYIINTHRNSQHPYKLTVKN